MYSESEIWIGRRMKFVPTWVSLEEMCLSRDTSTGTVVYIDKKKRWFIVEFETGYKEPYGKEIVLRETFSMIPNGRVAKGDCRNVAVKKYFLK